MSATARRADTVSAPARRLRPHEAEHAEHERCENEAELERAPGERLSEGEPRLHRRRHETAEAFAAPELEICEKGDEAYREPHKVDPLLIGEDQALDHGALTNTAPRANQPAAASSNPAASGIEKNSTYCLERSSVIRVRSRRSISS